MSDTSYFCCTPFNIHHQTLRYFSQWGFADFLMWYNITKINSTNVCTRIYELLNSKTLICRQFVNFTIKALYQILIWTSNHLNQWKWPMHWPVLKYVSVTLSNMNSSILLVLCIKNMVVLPPCNKASPKRMFTK